MVNYLSDILRDLQPKGTSEASLEKYEPWSNLGDGHRNFQKRFSFLVILSLFLEGLDKMATVNTQTWCLLHVTLDLSWASSGVPSFLRPKHRPHPEEGSLSVCLRGSRGRTGRLSSVTRWQGSGCRKWPGPPSGETQTPEPTPAPPSYHGPPPGAPRRCYLRLNSPPGLHSSLRKQMRSSRLRQHRISLGTEAGYSCGSALGGSPHPSAAPRAGPGHSLKLRQLPAVAQVGGQRSHVLWSEDALGQPEGRGQRAGPG